MFSNRLWIFSSHETFSHILTPCVLFYPSHADARYELCIGLQEHDFHMLFLSIFHLRWIVEIRGASLDFHALFRNHFCKIEFQGQVW